MVNIVHRKSIRHDSKILLNSINYEIFLFFRKKIERERKIHELSFTVAKFCVEKITKLYIYAYNLHI